MKAIGVAIGITQGAYTKFRIIDLIIVAIGGARSIVEFIIKTINVKIHFDMLQERFFFVLLNLVIRGLVITTLKVPSVVGGIRIGNACYCCMCGNLFSGARVLRRKGDRNFWCRCFVLYDV